MFFEFHIPILVRDVYNKGFQTTPKWPLANDTVIAYNYVATHRHCIVHGCLSIVAVGIVCYTWN